MWINEKSDDFQLYVSCDEPCDVFAFGVTEERDIKFVQYIGTVLGPGTNCFSYVFDGWHEIVTFESGTDIRIESQLEVLGFENVMVDLGPATQDCDLETQKVYDIEPREDFRAMTVERRLNWTKRNY